ncbi:hypothetical protein [Kineosporia babensis]|uniref:Uncharacterized protein n=1 Tax=Kineosporia babensis TaxID=499548 RepID=A0A9X1NFQ7_9ACTN|nr:hypothetical protein [Kineosporia babensis]MCD5312754.1 hypothetical protein [Kineosporia babensis]
MDPEWIPPRLRGPLGVVFGVIAVGVLGVSVYRTFWQGEVISGSFIGLMAGAWLGYGIHFWRHR